MKVNNVAHPTNPLPPSPVVWNDLSIRSCLTEVYSWRQPAQTHYMGGIPPGLGSQLSRFLLRFLLFDEVLNGVIATVV